MQFNSETPRRDLIIQDVSFAAPTPYVEGHTLTANEAAVLNQTLLENFRNNFASTVKAAKEEAEKAGSPLDEEALQEKFETYAAEYEFGARRIGARSSVDPVEREAIKIAVANLNKALKAQKIDKDTIPEARFDELVKGILDKYNDRIYTEAREIVESRKKRVFDIELNI